MIPAAMFCSALNCFPGAKVYSLRNRDESFKGHKYSERIEDNKVIAVCFVLRSAITELIEGREARTMKTQYYKLVMGIAGALLRHAFKVCPVFNPNLTFAVGDIVDGWPWGIEGQAVITGTETANE